MRPRSLAAGIALALLAGCATAPPGPSPSAPEAKLADGMSSVPSRPGVRQPFELARPATPPVATVILFPGGDGRLAGLRGNFLVRSHTLFVDEGFVVAIVDAPSDRTSLAGARQSSDHARDIAALIAALRTLAPVPVWLVGTSNGSVSAASVAAQLDTGGPDGVVLTSSVEMTARTGLDRIHVPTLVVHNRNDSCRASPPSLAPLLVQALQRATPRELLTFESTRLVSDPCEARSPHGYLGIEPTVVHAIAEWIKARR